MNTDLTRERLSADAARLKDGEAAYLRAKELIGNGYDDMRIAAFEKIKKLMVSAQANLVVAAPILVGRIAQIVETADEPVSVVSSYEDLRKRVEGRSASIES